MRRVYLLLLLDSRVNCSFVRTIDDSAVTPASILALERLPLVDIIEILFPFAQRKRVGNHYICELTALKIKNIKS